MNVLTRAIAVILAATAAFAQEPTQKEGPSATIVGYVRDSGCVHRFHEVIKPLPNGCVEACVRGGSPLVILTKDEQVYHPISAEMPDVDTRQKLLLPFIGHALMHLSYLGASVDGGATGTAAKVTDC